MLCLLGMSLQAQELELYPDQPPPFNRRGTVVESAENDGKVLRIFDVSHPTLTVFRPEHPNGMAVIICPGGGYQYLAFDKEGTRVATRLATWGVTAFVLKYRLPNDTLMDKKFMAPLTDARQAIRMVRRMAARWSIDSERVGIMGFSAGGHLASTAATHLDADSTPEIRPDFAILIYPVISMDSSITHSGSRNRLIGTNPDPALVRYFSNERQVTRRTPPVFLVQAEDDGAVPVWNSIRFYEACVEQHVPAEMHLYPHGGHGFGMNNATTADDWMERLRNWLVTLNKQHDR